MNKVYKIYLREYAGYDTYDAFIVSAPNIHIARHLAAEHAADEGSVVWKSSKWSLVQYIGKTRLKQGVILGSFNAG